MRHRDATPSSDPEKFARRMERLHGDLPAGSSLAVMQSLTNLMEKEAGLPTSEPCWKHGLRPAMFHKLKAKYVGIDLPDTKRPSAHWRHAGTCGT